MSERLYKNIRDMGLRDYLDQTRDTHHFHGYEDFIYYLSPRLKMSDTGLGRLFGVHRNTIHKWRVILREEE